MTRVHVWPKAMIKLHAIAKSSQWARVCQAMEWGVTQRDQNWDHLYNPLGPQNVVRSQRVLTETDRCRRR